MDQGRDLLAVRNIVVGQHPTLVGPTTSINGVFLGPLWYYFNVIPFVVGRGDPIYLVYWMILLYQTAGFLIWWFFKKRRQLFALLFSSLFLLSPAVLELTRFSWSANPMPAFVVFYLLALFAVVDKPNIKRVLILGLVIGLSLQIEAAFGVLLFPFALIVLLFYKIKKKHLFYLLAGFAVTFIPQILFEIRHNFIITHTLFAEFFGKGDILGNKLTLMETFQNHREAYINSVNNIIGLNRIIAQVLLIPAFIFFGVKAFRHQLKQGLNLYILISLLFIIFSFTVYMLYPHPLKSWYVGGLIPTYLIIISALLTYLINNHNIALRFASAGFVIATLLSVTSFQLNLITKDAPNETGDKSSLKNELKVLDYVYQKSNGEGFKVYNYLPSIYDYPYQYLFWWYGTKKYGYQPDTITYLDNVPEYIQNNSQYWTKKKSSTENSPIFLIIEEDKDHPEAISAWLGNFAKYCQKQSQTFDFGTEVRILSECNSN